MQHFSIFKPNTKTINLPFLETSQISRLTGFGRELFVKILKNIVLSNSLKYNTNEMRRSTNDSLPNRVGNFVISLKIEDLPLGNSKS